MKSYSFSFLLATQVKEVLLRFAFIKATLPPVKLARYWYFKKNAPCEDRTHDLQISN